MAENITTILEMREAMDPSEKPTLADLVYLIDGSGTPRDKPFPLSDIMELFQGGAASEIVLRTTGGSQEVTLTLTPSSITFTKVDGQTTTTRKIDFNGDETNLDSMRVKKVSGSTPYGASSFKLVVDTLTDFQNDIIIGKSNDLKIVTLNGNLKIVGGIVDSDLTVGWDGAGNEKNLTVHGDCKAKRFIANNILTVNQSGDTSLDMTAPVGSIVYVYNATGSTVNVYFIGGQYVKLKSHCALGFIKVNANDYAPLANETFYSPEM